MWKLVPCSAMNPLSNPNMFTHKKPMFAVIATGSGDSGVNCHQLKTSISPADSPSLLHFFYTQTQTEKLQLTPSTSAAPPCAATNALK